MQMDEMILEKVAQKENELNATYDEKMRNYEERFVPSVFNRNPKMTICPGSKTCSDKCL